MNAQTFKKDSFKTLENKDLDIYFIKHSSLILAYNGDIIYVDPISEYMDCSKQTKADIILITHEHGDHFDKNAINKLSKNTTQIILNATSAKKLKKGEVMKNGDKIQPVSYLNLEAVPAYNTTPDHKKYHPEGRDNGYILTIDGLRIYIAGDTEVIPEMRNLGKIDIAFLPVNQPYTMTVDQAVEAAKIIQPSVLYPYHYNETKVEQIKEQLENMPEIDVRIRDMQ